MAPGDKKTNRDLARSTTLSSTLVETKTICSQNEDNWTSAAVRRAVALRSRTPGGLSSHQRGASSSSARQRAGMSHAGGRPAWSGPPVRPPRGSGEHETATGVMDPRTRENEARGIRWDNMVITLIRGWIWTDLTMFPSGSSIRMEKEANAKKLQGCEVGETL